MSTNVRPVASVEPVTAAPQRIASGGADVRTARESLEPAPVDFRLVIEEDEGSGAYVYKTLDRNTGEVVNSLPREEILKLREDPSYDRGSLVDTKA